MIGEHSATHMNAPHSFIAGDKRSITSYASEQLVAPAAVINGREKSLPHFATRLTALSQW